MDIEKIYQDYQYALMPEEIKLLEEFQTRHSSCDPETREALIEEDAAPILFTIILHMTSIGMCPAAICEVCHVEESIMCKERADSF